MVDWTERDIPSLAGKRAVVTGTGGIGLATAVALAGAGAAVVIAGRNADRGAAAVAAVHAAAPGADVHFAVLDLARGASIAAFAAGLDVPGARLDLLINNAAVMAPPQRQVTADGFELQLGTNHLGHVALTARLWPLLRRTPRARVVTVSSVAARGGVIDLDDLQATKRYVPMGAYGQSKLANLMFAQELARRSAARGWGVMSMAAHPGLSRTELIPNGMGRASMAGVLRVVLGPIVFQSAARGALPSLYAATSPDAASGGYYGPKHLREIRGAPAPAQPPPQANDVDVAGRLFDSSAHLMGVSFDAESAPPQPLSVHT